MSRSVDATEAQKVTARGRQRDAVNAQFLSAKGPLLWQGAHEDLQEVSSAADAGSAGVGRSVEDRNVKPSEVIMACAAGRASLDEWS